MYLGFPFGFEGVGTPEIRQSKHGARLPCRVRTRSRERSTSRMTNPGTSPAHGFAWRARTHEIVCMSVFRPSTCRSTSETTAFPLCAWFHADLHR